jgi:hypothetical protein
MQKSGGRKRGLVRVLGVVLLFQGCLLLGMQAAPWLAARQDAKAGEEDPNARMIAWRRLDYRAEKDPRSGGAAPALRLRSVEGRAIALDRSGGPTAVVFVGDGET